MGAYHILEIVHRSSWNGAKLGIRQIVDVYFWRLLLKSHREVTPRDFVANLFVTYRLFDLGSPVQSIELLIRINFLETCI